VTVGRIVLVRHGETEWSATGRHTGNTDLPLLPAGEAQAGALARLIGEVLGGRRPALVLTSPLRRAARTAEVAGLSAEPEPDLREVDYGAYEGRTTPDIRRDAPGWTVWTGALPGGETLEAVAARADRVLARAAAVEGDAVLVAHGHLLRILAVRWLGLPPADGRLFALAAGSLCVLGREHETPVIARWNLTPTL
jgi:probable phosphoglycerate mutase